MSDQSQEPEGPQGVSGPDEKVSVSWLILQRLDDLKDQISVGATRTESISTRNPLIIVMRPLIIRLRRLTDVLMRSIIVLRRWNACGFGPLG